MRHKVALVGLAFVLTAGAGCGFVDVFSDPRLATILLDYSGPTQVEEGDTVPISVIVTLDGEALANPRVTLSSSDTTILGLLPDHSAIVGRADGRVTLTMRYESSLFTDNVPTLEREIRVRQTPGPP